MARRTQNNLDPIGPLGNYEFAQLQASACGALRTTAGDGDVYSVTFTTDTSAYASGDLIADTQLISATAVDQRAGDVILDSFTLVDEDAQGVKLYVLILAASTSLGTENSAPNISDANTRANVLGFFTVLTTDYITVSGVKIATVRNIGLHCKAAAASQALYCAILNDTGTPTYTATGMVGQFGFRQL